MLTAARSAPGQKAKNSTGAKRVRFSNRPFGVKRFQTIYHRSVDVARGSVLLFGTGTRSSESAPGPFHHGIRRRGGTIFRAAFLTGPSGPRNRGSLKTPAVRIVRRLCDRSGVAANVWEYLRRM